MKTRVISAVVMLVLVFGCFLISPYTRTLLLLAICIMSIWETCRVIKAKDVSTAPAVLYVYSAAVCALILFKKADEVYLTALFFLAVFAITFAGIIKKELRGPGALATLAVLAYPVFPIVLIMRLTALPGNTWIPVFAIGCVSTWICDSFALFGGKRFGKRHIVPEVSPHKTLAGFICGSISATVAGVGLYFALRGSFPAVTLPCCVITAFVASGFGQVGDLAASLIKRMSGFKDYSHLIPGHGGVMDRVDSLLFSVPAAYFCLYIAGLY